MQTPESSSSSSSSSPTRCRRDANCKCKICIASFNATLDLMPLSSQRSSLTYKLSSSKPSPPATPIFFNTSTISTPKSENSRLIVSPHVHSTPRVDLQTVIKKKNNNSNNNNNNNNNKKEFGFGLVMKCVFVLVLCLVLFVRSRVMKTKLSPEIVRNLGDKSSRFRDVKQRFQFLNNELQLFVSEASSIEPNWEIVQDGLMLRSRCQLYKSGIEEVSIWGWPLQTAGLLTTEFATRSFTILSGRVTEWTNGELSYSIREANTSWEQSKWASSVWRLDENTWILEYKRSFVFEHTREFLKYKMMRAFQWLWKLSDGNCIAPT